MGGWLDDLTPAMRAELRRLHRMNPWMSVGKLLTLVGLWLGAANLALSLDPPWLALPCWVLMGFVFHGLGVLAHEGAHGNLLGWGWVDRAVGFLCGLPICFPCNNYRATHLLHHRYENTELDPDNLEANCPAPWMRALVFYTWYVAGIYLYVLLLAATGPFRARTAADRLICVLESVTMAALFTVLFREAAAHGLMDVLVRGWLLGIPFAGLIANVRGLAEHCQLEHGRPPDPLRSTRTTLSHPLVEFFFNNQNYHLEHHLFPQVPWYHLPRLHRLLRPLYEKHGASIAAEGYLRGLQSGVVHGPMQTFRYTSDGRAIPKERQDTPRP